jgi:error-prone DNA polymerase
MMAAIRESIDLIHDHYHEEVDLAHIPVDQPDVYDAIRKADTVGMFQIESRAQMASLPRNIRSAFTISSCKWLSFAQAQLWDR